MKISEYDDHCGECPLINWCGAPFLLPHLCCDSRFKNRTAEEYISLAETSKVTTPEGEYEDEDEERDAFLEAVSDDVYERMVLMRGN